MNPETNPSKMNENLDAKDLIKMQTEVGLLESMLQSKTLTVFVIVGLLLLGGFFLFLFNMAS